ncbi:MAG TPA: hypothetical protein VNA21_13265 [Steroidobacteraceae bacterium]|nr:hypothetical protein [Steroidobacteraceae bacterium]
MIALTRLMLLLGVLLLFGCASSSTLTSKWKSNEAAPLAFRGKKVVAAVITNDASRRRLSEDRLAQQIAVRGAEGRTMHSLLPGATAGNEPAMRAALEAANVKGLIVMEPIYVHRDVRITPAYEGGGSASLWGGSYGTGFAMSYSTPREAKVSESTVVYIETRVYSLEQNKLVWAAQSRSTDPDTLTELIEELSAAIASELQKEGLIQ